MILLTGGAGYIGSHMAHRLLALGEKIIVYDNLSKGFRQAIPQGASFIFGDIRDGDLLGRVIKDQKVESIVHFAAKSVVPESVQQPLEYYENNVIGTLQLVKAAKKYGVKNIIFSSSASVYGDPKEVPLLETSPLNPTSPYGKTKKMGEEIIKDGVIGESYKFVSLRYFNVAGASVDLSNGQRTENATHLVKVAAEAACGIRSEVQVFGSDYSTKDGTGLRDYIHVEDLVEAHVDALKYLKNGGSSQVFNCGYGKGFTVLELLNAMKKVSGKDFKVVMKDRRPGDVAKSFADPTKIRKTLNWTPRFEDLEIICRSAFQWEQKYRASK
jgi:UDP-glucose 4-epimerase